MARKAKSTYTLLDHELKPLSHLEYAEVFGENRRLRKGFCWVDSSKNIIRVADDVRQFKHRVMVRGLSCRVGEYLARAVQRRDPEAWASTMLNLVLLRREAPAS